MNRDGDRDRGDLFLLLGWWAGGFPQLPSALGEGQTVKALGTWSQVKVKQGEVCLFEAPWAHISAWMRRGKGIGGRERCLVPRNPVRFQAALLLGCMQGPCQDPARVKEMSSGNGKFSQQQIPLLWDREIAPFRTCHLFLAWPLGLTHCCYWSWRRRAEEFPCSKASVPHWAQDGLGRFLIPGMRLFIDPNAGNKMTWLTSTLRCTPCSPCTQSNQRDSTGPHLEIWRLGRNYIFRLEVYSWEENEDCAKGALG